MTILLLFAPDNISSFNIQLSTFQLKEREKDLLSDGV